MNIPTPILNYEKQKVGEICKRNKNVEKENVTEPHPLPSPTSPTKRRDIMQTVAVKRIGEMGCGGNQWKD